MLLICFLNTYCIIYNNNKLNAADGFCLMLQICLIMCLDLHRECVPFKRKGFLFVKKDVHGIFFIFFIYLCSIF